MHKRVDSWYQNSIKTLRCIVSGSKLYETYISSWVLSHDANKTNLGWPLAEKETYIAQKMKFCIEDFFSKWKTSFFVHC